MGSDYSLEEAVDSMMSKIVSFGDRKIVRNLTSGALPSQVFGDLTH